MVERNWKRRSRSLLRRGDGAKYHQPYHDNQKRFHESLMNVLFAISRTSADAMERILNPEFAIHWSPLACNDLICAPQFNVTSDERRHVSRSFLRPHRFDQLLDADRA